MSDRRWVVQERQESDEEALRDLFAVCFGHPISHELWQWKYGQGRGLGVVVKEGGKIIASINDRARKISYFGHEAIGGFVGDVMVAPKSRGVLSRKGPIFLVTSKLLGDYYGDHKKRLVGAGFPNERAMRVAELLGFYAEVDTMVALHWQPQRLPVFTHVLAPFQPHPANAAMVDALWHAMKKDLPSSLIGFRDWDYLQHRYVRHPEYAYRFYGVYRRLSKHPLALLVVKEQLDRIDIMDVVASLADLPAAIGAARRFFKKPLHGWMTESHAHHFEKTNPITTPLGIRIPANTYSDGPKPETLRGKWWLTMGDTDDL
jgi:hypothetical protein